LKKGLTCPKKRVVYALVARENENGRLAARDGGPSKPSRAFQGEEPKGEKKPLSKSEKNT
jgi:hypothetical protein